MTACHFRCNPDRCYREAHRDKHGRTRLPDERVSKTIKFNLPAPPTVSGSACNDCGAQPDSYKAIKGYILVGLYPCGCIGEIFIRCGIEGELVRGLLDSFATMFSIALQHGAPVETLLAKCVNSSFQPAGWTGDERHPYAKSVLDYTMSLLAKFAGVKRSPDDDVEPDELIQALRLGYDRGQNHRAAHSAGLQEDTDKGK